MELGVATIVRLGLAVVLGGLIGLERQMHGRPAGLRTHILVCLGAALVMILTSAFGEDVDPGRGVAGIVTGVGFLGAGVIVKSRELVRGLTTAACIWFVATIGIAIGQGLYLVAAIGAAAGVTVLTVFDRLAHAVPSVTYHKAVVEGAGSGAERIEAECRRMLGEIGYRVVAVACNLDRANDSATLTLRLRARRPEAGLMAPHRILAIEGVRRVVWD